MLNTNTVKAKDPNEQYKQFLREVTDDRGRTTVLSTVPLRNVNTNKVRPRAFALDPAVLNRALNKDRRPATGFPPLQTADMRDIEDNRKRLAVAAQKKAAAAKVVAKSPAKAVKGRKRAK